MAKYHLMYRHINTETIKAVCEHWKVIIPKCVDLKRKQEGFSSLLERFCEIYKIKKTPQLKIEPNLSGKGVFIPLVNIILMNKYSLITFLHEFKHYKDWLEGKKPNEDNAKGWSLSLMYQVNPKYFCSIVKKGMVCFVNIEDITEEPEESQRELYCDFCFSRIREDSAMCPECGALVSN